MGYEGTQAIAITTTKTTTTTTTTTNKPITRRIGTTHSIQVTRSWSPIKSSVARQINKVRSNLVNNQV